MVRIRYLEYKLSRRQCKGYFPSHKIWFRKKVLMDKRFGLNSLLERIAYVSHERLFDENQALSVVLYIEIVLPT